jgi:hypothetical protein
VRQSFSRIFKSRSFVIGYFLTLLLLSFVSLNSQAFDQELGILGRSTYGIPFPYLVTHCWGHFYIWPGLAGNAVVGAVCSTVGGTVSTLFISKLRVEAAKINRDEWREWWEATRSKWYL